ncbi:GIY-YIG nuclease family protein [Spiroplasma endosymbiont of Atherix ibis]|uniref:GIY-YIG nuclease family protein n=1 Tax=Spiroplasma endosymbiont of Atherix ibis TaxID=3066291 RepID=UPI0030D4D86D
MKISDQFKIISKIKNSTSLDVKILSEIYILEIINKLLENRKKLKFNELNEIDNNKAGVYLLYSIVNNRLKFCYIGESVNVKERFNQHIKGYINKKNKMYSIMNKRIESIRDINFVFLEEIENQNNRLKKETYYIYTTKSKHFSLNTKLVNRKLRCPNGHGLVKGSLSYDKNKDYIHLILYGICKNKNCKIKFQIN